MRFSSIALSVLAQSVPLLAVGHLAGWKRREERSWLQSRRLRDALLVRDHDKKGMLFEKREGVHGKQDNDVLEEKRSGSTRRVQDSASSEVPSEDRKSFVECDPLSTTTDSGIFSCGMDSHCIESEESELGGLCVAANLAPSINRALQTGCVEGPDEYGVTCDCSQFNDTSGLGNYTCTEPLCIEKLCGNYTLSSSYNADGSFANGYCLEFNSTIMGLDSYCLSVSSSSDLNSTECELEFNGIACNSCEYTQEICPANSSYLPFVFDCTNTIIDIQGDTCDGGSFLSFLNAAEIGAPSASPDEMPSPATSSGSSHAAKVTFVVSAAAAACVASFGT